MKVKLKLGFYLLMFKIATHNFITLRKVICNMSVDEYTRELENLLIKWDIRKPKEQTIVRYLGGLEPKYANVVEVQQFTTFDKVCVLAQKVKQRKKNPFRCEYSECQTRNQPFNKGSSSPTLKPTVQYSPTPQKSQTPQKAYTPTKSTKSKPNEY